LGWNFRLLRGGNLVGGETLEARAVWRPINDRTPNGVLVCVYKNLASRDPKRQWSVKALEGPHKGLKVAEGESVTLVGVRPFVREATRQRILSGGRGGAAGHRGHREVHAWLIGRMVDELSLEAPARVTYHPFERGEFFYAADGRAFTSASAVVFAADGSAYVEGGRCSRGLCRCCAFGG
jgi:hypothetical protein